jgi:hypothetical protein
MNTNLPFSLNNAYNVYNLEANNASFKASFREKITVKNEVKPFHLVSLSLASHTPFELSNQFCHFLVNDFSLNLKQTKCEQNYGIIK